MHARALAATALAYAVLHHLGLLPAGLGLGLGAGPDGTRWNDWLDLAVPWLVLAPAALTLHAAPGSRQGWLLLAAGAVAYSSGHGIHLAANSVGNVDPGPTAHLWDEVVGHHVWYAGVALVLAALATTLPGRPRPGAVGHVLAVAVGLTWATNAVGGGTEAMSALVAVAAVAYGWRHRDGLGLVLPTGFGSSLVVLAGLLLAG